MGAMFALVPFSGSYTLLVIVSFLIGASGGGIIADSYKMIQDHFEQALIPWVVGYDTISCYAAATVVQLLLGQFTFNVYNNVILNNKRKK